MSDEDGSVRYSNIINSEITTLSDYKLDQNYPNPWNPSTTIHYQVPSNTKVEIKLYNPIGREVETLVNGLQTAGEHEITLNGINLSSGVYYYQMKAGSFVATRKLVFLK